MFTPDPAIAFESIRGTQLAQIARRMPKAELHLHIEGSLEPELMFSLAKKNRVQLAHDSVEALRQAYAFGDLQSFLDIYYAGASALIDEDDFFQMAWAYFLRAAQDHIVHSEIFFDPQTHTERGVSMATVINGLVRAQRKAQSELGINSQLIMCFLRHLSEEDAIRTLEQALPFREHFIGIGLDSSEKGHPPEKFARVYDKAKRLGLRLVAHAGEEGPPAYIWGALDSLQVERIDHGVRAIEDSELIERLRLARTPLTVCPLSNVKLRVFSELGDHNLAMLLDKGLCITLNSDDPAYFGGYLNENIVQSIEALNLSARQVWQLAANSFEASFVAPAQKRKWVTQLNQAFIQALA